LERGGLRVAAVRRDHVDATVPAEGRVEPAADALATDMDRVADTTDRDQLVVGLHEQRDVRGAQDRAVAVRAERGDELSRQRAGGRRTDRGRDATRRARDKNEQTA
jgi:hypothetical protein